MSDALFSSFLMVDRPVSPVAGRHTFGGTDASERHEHPLLNDRERLLAAILRALEEAAPSGGGTQASVSPSIGDLAAAAADIALGQSVVLQLKPDLGEGHRGAVRAFLEMVLRVSATLDESRLESAISKLAEVLLPDDLADARGALAADNLELRDRFITEVPQFTSAEISAQAGLKTKNPYATAARWKKSGDIFSVQHRGKEYFPAFQFREGRPHPTIKKALAALPARMSSWQRAFWLVSTNGWLDDRAPADALDESHSVVAAAEREGEEVVG